MMGGKGVRGRVVAIVLWGVTVAPAAFAAPKAVLSDTQLDLGRVERGGSVEKSFTISNEGDEPLELLRFQSSCPCAEILPPPENERTIPPGASKDLTIRYVPDEREGPASASLVVYTNDPENSVLIVDITVFIDVLVSVRPATGVYWGMIPRGQPVEDTLVFAPGDPANGIELLDIRATSDAITLRAEDHTDEDEPHIEVHLAIKPDAPMGTLEGTIEARVRVGEEVADISAPFRGNVIGDLLLTPPAIISPKTAYKQGEKISEITVQSSLGGTPPDVVGAMVVGPLKAVIEKNVDGGTKHKVGVFAADNARTGPQSGTVYVMTTSADDPIVAVPVYARMASPVVALPDHAVLSSGGEPVRIEVRNLQTHGLRIERIHHEDDIVQVDVVGDSQTSEAEPAAFTIKALPNAPQKTTLIAIQTDWPGGEQVVVPVMIRD